MMADMIAAAMVMAVVMMAALNIGIIVQFSRRKGFHGLVGTPGNTAVQPDSRLRQCILGTAADSAADQDIFQ